MLNSPDLDGKYLGTITSDFALVAHTLKEASYQLRVRKIAEHPIFPICKIDQPVGQLLVDKHEMALKWNFYFSFLDEFKQRGLVDDLAKFQQNYKDPDEFCCLFVVDNDFVNFIYVPYPEDTPLV
ncbi:MAG: hypothetical protein ACPGJS_07940 [Flammeovirgaceae bacterium]